MSSINININIDDSLEFIKTLFDFIKKNKDNLHYSIKNKELFEKILLSDDFYNKYFLVFKHRINDFTIEQIKKIIVILRVFINEMGKYIEKNQKYNIYDGDIYNEIYDSYLDLLKKFQNVITAIENKSNNFKSLFENTLINTLSKSSEYSKSTNIKLINSNTNIVSSNEVVNSSEYFDSSGELNIDLFKKIIEDDTSLSNNQSSTNQLPTNQLPTNQSINQKTNTNESDNSIYFINSLNKVIKKTIENSAISSPANFVTQSSVTPSSVTQSSVRPSSGTSSDRSYRNTPNNDLKKGISNFFSFGSSTPVSKPKFVSKITPIQPQLTREEKLDNKEKLDKINNILTGLPALRITTTTKDNTRLTVSSTTECYTKNGKKLDNCQTVNVINDYLPKPVAENKDNGIIDMFERKINEILQNPDDLTKSTSELASEIRRNITQNKNGQDIMNKLSELNKTFPEKDNILARIIKAILDKILEKPQ